MGTHKKKTTWLKSSCTLEKIEDCKPENWKIRKGQGVDTWYTNGLSLVFGMFQEISLISNSILNLMFEIL